MISFIKKYFRTGFGEMLTYDEDRAHFQFVSVFILLSFISLVMTVMNIITHFHTLMISTAVFCGVNIVNSVLMFLGPKCEKVARVLFSVEVVALFTFFIVMGEPQGFSAIWAALLPSSGLLLYKRKYGIALSGVMFLILAFFYWTPFGQSFLPVDPDTGLCLYTAAFRMRFPVLYCAFFLVGLFFEITRSVTQKELTKARDNYKRMYTEEEMRAEIEKRKNFEIVQILASEYSCVCYINFENDEMKVYSESTEIDDNFDDYFKTGNSFEEVFKNFVNGVVFEEDRQLMLSAGAVTSIKEELSDQKTFVTVFRAVKNGEIRYNEMKFVKVGDNIGEPVAVALAFSDRDKAIRKEIGQQLALEEALKKAEDASAAKTKFLFNMSHDIRTPMNAIIGFTDMAKKYRKDDEKLEECLDKVRVSGQHLLNLINDVLDMSRIENGKIDIEETEGSVSEIVDNLALIVDQSAKDKNITLITDCSGVADNLVYVDTLHLNRILLNIIGNAVKYTNDGGRIDFTARQLTADDTANKYEFVVRDNGIGMSEEYLGKIFEAFSREKSSTVSGIQGTGLGMAITKRLVELMKGDIAIVSSLGEGTTVTVTVTLRKSVKYEHKKVEEEEKIDCASISGKRVLLVEDNELNREIAKDILEDEELIVEEAEDGNIAVDMVKSHAPDYYGLVLMDIQMPTMNGYEATRAIRQMPGYGDLPIVAMTANAFEEDRRNAFNAGMNDHLAKPIEIPKLFEVLEKYL